MIKGLAFILLLATMLGITTTLATSPGEEAPNDTEASVIFNDRIMPIFRSPDPSSCVQCHLSSVDLKNYILPSHEKTFVSLRDQGMIDLDDPAKSKILTFITMGDKDADAGAKLVHEDMRKAEFEAFAAWIRACCSDDELRNLPPMAKSEYARPDQPNEVIRHARKSRVVDSFVRNVWSQRMRCFPCHTPHEIGPQQKNAREKFEDWQSKYGDQMLIFKETPEETIQFLVDESRKAMDNYLPLLNLDEPTKSLLVLKPTSKIPPKNADGDHQAPTYTEPIYHMGGLKMHMNDHSYKAFVAWIQDYANVTHGNYAAVDDLPTDNWYPTKRVLRMRDVPGSWTIGTPVQMFVYSRNADRDGWSDQPMAFTQGTITPKHIVNGPLILLAPTDSDEFEKWRSSKDRIPKADYLIKIYMNSDGRLADDPALLLDSTDYRGEVEIKNNTWKAGFPGATWISAGELGD